jgi:hypothetical protein
MADTHDTRNLWFWLLSAIAVLGLCILGAVLWSARQTSYWAQLIGSLLALFGLLYTYLRANHHGDTVREQLAQFSRRLLGKPQRVSATVHVPRMEARGRLSAHVEVGLPDRPELELQEQIDHLAQYIREHVLRGVRQAFERLEQLQSRIDRVEEIAAEKAAEAYDKARADIDALRRELDQSAGLDLRWAVFGVYIATIGVALSICA